MVVTFVKSFHAKKSWLYGKATLPGKIRRILSVETGATIITPAID